MMRGGRQQLRDGASRTRTGDLLGAIQALFQLSYSPAFEGARGVPAASQGKDTRHGLWASDACGKRIGRCVQSNLEEEGEEGLSDPR